MPESVVVSMRVKSATAKDSDAFTAVKSWLPVLEALPSTVSTGTDAAASGAASTPVVIVTV